ncbi:hypothetical protein CLOBOL_01942 [Enterocloster bolteae ATCC BAA-613]|uniref:Uncharacterized protein n=1 Tax=Enterocloster bolteae (strain ATCC BAA-613 / DSM 15670 / CCUG 46953 / JCM 12243 / WAL 16351) TaxID=411902 RepID=A8RMK7_ENTBW|nr:hypothetical protein CLOBOL_01942 [Enterocloster bolteae ATCC BAA-613]
MSDFMKKGSAWIFACPLTFVGYYYKTKKLICPVFLL